MNATEKMKNGMCGEYRKVESTYDPRTNAVLDNCNEIRETAAQCRADPSGCE
ncbi:MAG: hypothetical protein WA130_01640 [Candidatus Methanoperedens sp.]